MSKKMLTRSSLRNIKEKKTKVSGHKVVTDDVKKLKSLAGTPMIPETKIFDYYVEPVTIEYYIPKESRFAYETKYIYIELYDPEPKNETQTKVFNYFKEKNQPIDVMEVMNVFPEHMIDILEHFNPRIDLFESMSVEFHSGLRDNEELAIRRALYLNEVIRKKEPSIPALEILGDYTTFNINWCIRYLNRHGVDHSLEDQTVQYLIKLHNMKAEAEGRQIDERFIILTEIYREQAFPDSDEDIFEDIGFSEDYRKMI